MYFKHYTHFCCNHPNALMTLEKKSKKEQFAKLLKVGLLFAFLLNFFTPLFPLYFFSFFLSLQDAQARPECKGLTLPSFLIKPIQRICKYPLLIRVPSPLLCLFVYVHLCYFLFFSFLSGIGNVEKHRRWSRRTSGPLACKG